MSWRNYIFFVELGLIATLIVLALSWADIPVEIPFFDSIDTVILAISVDTVESQAKFVDEYKIPYIHLSDTQKIVCKKYAGLNMVGLAKRSTFVIDKKGIIRHIFRDIDAKNHGNQILDSLKQI